MISKSTTEDLISSATDLAPAFHVMAKPTGAQCNLRCDYCFYLDKEQLYAGSRFRMSDATLEAYVRQTVEGHRTAEVTLAWQGGEPTLMGLGFFRRAAAVAREAARPGKQVTHTLQTNGVLLDDDWCAFLAENGFLVGLSLDGPRHLHDAYRRDRAGASVFDKVEAAARRLQAHGVDFNILCTVNAANAERPLEVYRYFRDELGVRYLQLVPIVELRAHAGGAMAVSDRSVQPAQYGRFLIEIFDEWVRRDVGKVFVPFFDGVLAAWLFGRSELCTLAPECGLCVALEHNGDVYSCDHFVESAHLLGNIHDAPLAELVASEKQRAFGRDKSGALSPDCRSCRYLFTCYGECPKNRVPGVNGKSWLCEGLRAFFTHTEHSMKQMADLLRRGEPAHLVANVLAGAPRGTQPDDPCPCGGGASFRECHGRAD